MQPLILDGIASQPGFFNRLKDQTTVTARFSGFDALQNAH
jgi:hypothetical protein